MNKRIFVVILLSLVLAGCGGGGSDSGGGGGKNNLIVVVGDSIAFGIGTPKNFSTMLGQLTGIPVKNVSTPGISAEEGAGRVPALIRDESPKYLVILLGTNNAAGAGGGVQGAINSIRFIVTTAIQAGVIPIIITLPHITRSSAENANAERISQGYRVIAGARIADARKSMNGSHIGPDGVHPNVVGHEIIATSVFAQIK